MNERIKELLVKAGLYECDVNDPEFVIPEEQKKFAELIVRECLNKVNECVMVRNTNRYYPTEYGCKIKEHFGVEE